MRAAVISILTTLAMWALIYYALNYGLLQPLAYWRDI